MYCYVGEDLHCIFVFKTVSCDFRVISSLCRAPGPRTTLSFFLVVTQSQKNGKKFIQKILELRTSNRRICPTVLLQCLRLFKTLGTERTLGLRYTTRIRTVDEDHPIRQTLSLAAEAWKGFTNKLYNRAIRPGAPTLTPARCLLSYHRPRLQSMRTRVPGNRVSKRQAERQPLIRARSPRRYQPSPSALVWVLGFLEEGNISLS
jgi:hypothetical protein